MYSQTNLPPNSASAFLQPSRAWSKNGLFMFFGTSAKMFCAIAVEPIVAAAMAMTEVANSFFKSSSLVACRRVPGRRF